MANHPKGIFEIAGTRLDRGIFELKLEKKVPRVLAVFFALGPIVGRLFALAFLLGSALLKYYNQPAKFLLSIGVLGGEATLNIGRIQDLISWAVFVLGLTVYAFVFLFRKETLLLIFDKGASELRYIHSPLLAKASERERLVPFSGIKGLRVYGADKKPVTLHGYFEIVLPSGGTTDNSLFFAFMSDEQRQYFPLNISKIVGKDVQGDWVDSEA